jgi:hypothetical protein
MQDAQMELQVAQNKRNALDEEAYIAQLKLESDTRAGFVKKVQSAIDAETKDTKSSDAVTKAKAESVVKYLN